LLKEILYKWILPKLISRSCGSGIPRSGKEGEKVNCFVVALDRDDSPFFIATDCTDKMLTGLKWNGNSYASNHRLGFKELDNGKLRITHYYGLATITYDSIYDLTWNQITKLVYIKVIVRRHIENLFQYFFNKRKLVTKKRMELIQFMMDDQLDRDHDGINSFHLMEKLYSINWVLHPSGDDQLGKLELYLDSLVLSEDIRKVNSDYVVTGKAISTIEKYEEEERRHTEAVKLQKKMFWLTILLLFVAVVQSGVVKLPTLLDLSEKSHNNSSKRDAVTGDPS